MNRLFTTTGKARLSLDERRLLRACERLLPAVDEARGELVDAISKDDAAGCVAAARRFLGLGLLLGDFVREEHSMKVDPAA